MEDMASGLLDKGADPNILLFRGLLEGIGMAPEGDDMAVGDREGPGSECVSLAVMSDVSRASGTQSCRHARSTIDCLVPAMTKLTMTLFCVQ
jgi:hypothetical protein